MTVDNKSRSYEVIQRFILLLLCMLNLTVMPITAQDDSTRDSQMLTVWIPAPLISDMTSDAYQQLLKHTTQLSIDTDINVSYRIKDVGTLGGIMSTIRSGSIVAPGALPDLALIRYSDLISSQAPTLLQSFENLFSSTLLNDLNNVLKLGQVPHNDGVDLFGLPYFVDVQHTVTNQTIEDSATHLTFDTVLTGDSLLLPAERNNGLNQIVYLQYLEVGGVAPRNGTMTINQNALQIVLEFYETAIEQNLITPEILDFASPSAYRTEFINTMEGLNYAIFSSSEYLSMLQQNAELYYETIPTATGNSITTLNGWVWVMITPDPTQQDISVRYLNWMMQPDFHADLSSELHQLPAQQSALATSLPDQIDPEFFEDLLTQSVLPLPESEGGTVPRAIQEALIRVVNGEVSAEEATLEIMEQFSSN
jgi:hypothetical protein